MSQHERESARLGNRASLFALLKRYRQIILYGIFGFLTFLVSVGVYGLCVRILMLNVLIANVISWIIAVLFAFFTNRKWVFDGDKAAANGLWRQMLSFFGGRLFTLAVEELILLVFVTWLRLDGMLVKIVAQVVVIVLNYFISKFFVFRHPEKDA